MMMTIGQNRNRLPANPIKRWPAGDEAFFHPVFGIIAMNGTIFPGDLVSSLPANIKNVDKVFRSTVT